MSLNCWLYFLNIEKEFASTTSFVEPHPSNYQTFSDKYAALLLLIGSEVDVVAKLLCKQINPSSQARTILDYQQEISGRFPGMHDIEINISRYGLLIKPWSAWSTNEPNSPAWWKSYNDVKHDRAGNTQSANLKNVIEGLCGLLALNLYYYRDEDNLQPYPYLLEFAFPAYIVDDIFSTKKLPGV